MKLLTESIEVTELNLIEERFGFGQHVTPMRSLNGSITLKFVSSGNFSLFINKHGKLKRKKLMCAIFMSLSKMEIEL